eukprot:TRINITY_DN7606_c0_g1_i1.p1 TRINITY_DN7606_c0_g1~~TRINITY_DN7606_c0_g1_i1.p1  ORF type:complete len:608 (+),score=104.97 TRINITY_DN7606_c0_g1_i1:587-2410(+)
MVKTFVKLPCSTDAMMYKSFYLPGDPTKHDTGIRYPQWNEPAVVGMPPRQSVFKQVFFPVIGTRYPLSGFGQIGVRVGETEFGGAGRLTLTQMLMNVAAVSTELNDVLFLITSEGCLAGSSVPGQNLEVRANDRLLGLTRADNISMVKEPILSVSRELLSRYCVGENNVCDWKGVDVVHTFGEYLVIYTPIEDELAAKLNLLLVVTVSESEITKPADDLNKLIAIISSGVLILFALLAVLLGAGIANPVVRFTEKIYLSSQLELSEIDTSETSFLTEIQKMNKSLEVLVAALTLYKSFLPMMLLHNEDSDEYEYDTKTISMGTQSGESTSSQGTEEKGPKPPAIRTAITFAAKRRTGTVIAANIRSWCQSAMIKEPEILEAGQTEFVSVVSRLAIGGTLDYVNGDRCSISFLKSAQSGLEAACANSLRLRTNEKEDFLKHMVVGLSTGTLTFGVMGVESYRSMQVCGYPVTVANRMVACASQRSDETTIIVLCETATASCGFKTMCSGIVMLRNETAVIMSDLLSSECKDEWIYDEGKIPLDAYNDAFKQYAGEVNGVQSVGGWENLQEAAGRVKVPVASSMQHLKMLSSSPEEFLSVASMFTTFPV